jgi:hypothetical protein
MERSLEEKLPNEIEHLWVEDARRYRELRKGTARSTSSEEVFARIHVRQR